MTPPWTLANAEAFLEQIAEELNMLGVQARIVGSVATAGLSGNDLDLLLAPVRPMSLETILGAIESYLLPRISVDKRIEPLPSGCKDDEWFVNVQLRDGRIVEFYMPEADFPLEPEE